MSTQQQETLSYFQASAGEWRLKAEGKLRRVNMIAQRNGAVMRVRRKMEPVERFLDLGCGTGELVLDMAATGVESLGIDFAPGMIRACEEKKQALGARNASFVCGSIFEFDGANFDLISGLGLIEYLSPAELVRLIERVHAMLRPGGAFVVGSRNRLFNLFSLNEYTLMDQALGVTSTLIAEAVAIAGTETQQAAITAASTNARRLPHPASHPGTGIGVGVRYQYTPGELIARLREGGLKAATLFPVHYHGVPAPAKQRLMDVHIQISNLAYEAGPEDHQLLPFSSSFVLEACRS
jgi:2-polyprenyl-3-methyl-5-hydroxy-6-metoxy-1,4-benzoquinol methylase